MIQILDTVPDTFSWGENSFTVSVYTDSDPIQITDSADFITIDELTADSVTFIISQNTSPSQRYGYIDIMDSSNATARISFNQEAYTYYPIWMDKDFTFETNADAILYKVYDATNDELLYSGKANKYPDANEITFNINSICGNYIDSDLEYGFNREIDFQKNINGFKQFKIQANSQDYQFFDSYNNWSYLNHNFINDGGNIVLSDPINYTVDYRQYFVFSVITPYFSTTRNVSWSLYKKRQPGQMPPLPVLNSKQVDAKGMYTITDGNLTKDLVSIQAADKMYDVVDSCKRYCLYYVNGFGGWDSFLINGNDKKNDTIQQHTLEKYANNTTQQFAKKNYLNKVTTKYTLYTHYLNDEEASKMWHLLESTQVYLHNLEEDKIIPVLIKDTSVDYKTFTNNGKKKFYYTINVAESQEKIRR